jgi:hypothetical protein
MLCCAYIGTRLNDLLFCAFDGHLPSTRGTTRIVTIALGQAREGGSRNESVKPFNGVQPVISGPVKAVAGGPVASIASRRATGGGEYSKEAGREDSAPTSFCHRDADAVSLAEGSIRAADNARLLRGRRSR